MRRMDKLESTHMGLFQALLKSEGRCAAEYGADRGAVQPVAIEKRFHLSSPTRDLLDLVNAQNHLPRTVARHSPRNLPLALNSRLVWVGSVISTNIMRNDVGSAKRLSDHRAFSCLPGTNDDLHRPNSIFDKALNKGGNPIPLIHALASSYTVLLVVSSKNTSYN